jgi:hypothetical protein
MTCATCDDRALPGTYEDEEELCHNCLADEREEARLRYYGLADLL